MSYRNVSIVWLAVAPLLLALPVTAVEVVVHNFDDGSTQGWTAVGARPPGLVTAAPGPSGLPGDRFLRFGDRSNAQPEEALKLFAPPPITGGLGGVAATCGALELDFRVFEDNDREVTFRLDLQVDPDGFAQGEPPRIAAIFRLDDALTETDGWVHVVVPLTLGNPPSNASGEWVMAPGHSAAAWDDLLAAADVLFLPLELVGISEEYGVDNVRLVTGLCPTRPDPESCLVPPDNLAAWWPLDDAEGVQSTVDIAGNTVGRRIGDFGAGPGVVGGAFRFDGSDWVAGEDAPLLDFEAGQDFSIDFWIRTVDASGVRVLLEKRDFSGSPIGWQLFLRNGNPGLQLATGSGPAFCSFDPADACTNYETDFDVADGTWHFVAVTVKRDDPQGVRWYLDGLPVGPPQDPRVRNLDLSNDHEVRIGAGTVAGDEVAFHFIGELDEIEVFRQALEPDDVQKIFLAESAGKCDTDLLVPWDTSIVCDDVEIEIRNDSDRVQTYDLAFAPLPQGTLAHPDFPCSVDGPTQFTLVSPADASVQVPPRSRVPIEVGVAFAPGATTGFGCYEVTATPRSGGRVLRRAGSVMVPTQACCSRGGSGGRGVPPFEVDVFSFECVNLTPLPLVFNFQLDVVDADMQADDSGVGLDGGEPGVPVVGQLALGPNEAAAVPVAVELTEFETFNPFELLIRDLDLPGPANVLSSQAVRSVGVGECLEGARTLCLADDRFQVSVAWEDFQGNDGPGQALPLTPDTGMFWFFHPANIELVVKVLDARPVNGHFWVFYGALSNVGYTIHVRDTQTGATRSYVNPSGEFASRGDTAAFRDDSAAAPSTVRGEDLVLGHVAASGSWGMVQIPGDELAGGAGLERVSAAQGTCAPDATSFCLHGARFRVSSEWATTQGTSGVGQAIPLTSDTGAFWFFDQANVELVVKIIDGRTVNGNWWVFYGSLSNVEFVVQVDDTERNRRLSLFNPQGNFGSRGETELLDGP